MTGQKTRHKIAVPLMLGLLVGLSACSSGGALSDATTAPGKTASGTPAPGTTPQTTIQSASAPAAQQASAPTMQSPSAPTASMLAPPSSQAGQPNPIDTDAIRKSLDCAQSVGLEKALKALGPDGQNLLDAITAALTGRDLAAVKADLFKALVVFGIDVGPGWLGCFKPYFFPNQVGGGVAPTAPIDLTVTPNPNNDTVLSLTWNDSSNDALYFVVSNGVEERKGLGQSGTGTVTYTWTGLQPHSWTCFKVRASNGDESSNWDPGVTPWYTCAYTSSLQPTQTSTATSAPVPSTPCVLLLPNQVDCTSSNAEVTLEAENIGDTSGCTFSDQVTWGDGSQQTVQYQGANGVPTVVATHTYQQNGTYSVTATPSVLSGPCTSSNGSYTFTYG